MADTIHKVSDRMIDWAVRLEEMSDAAKGKRIRRRGFGTRWLLLPAAGAGLYALATSGSFSRQAKDVMDQAKTRATELPDDLMGRLRQTTQKPTSANGAARKPTTARKSSGRRRKTQASRKTAQASR
jgi:hypothetical protein